MNLRRVHHLIAALAALLAATAPAMTWAQTGGNSAILNPYTMDRFATKIGPWMEAQAVYWRRVQYADIASQANTKTWYRKSHLIDAQLYIQYARVALLVDGNAKQALDDLGHAESLVNKGEKGAGKSETSQIKQIASAIDSLKGEIPKTPATSPAPTTKSAADLSQVFLSLRHVVENG